MDGTLQSASKTFCSEYPVLVSAVTGTCWNCDLQITMQKWITFLFVTIAHVLLLTSGTLQWKPARAFQSMIGRPFQSRVISSTELLKDCSTALKVQQPWNAPRWVWSFAWFLQRKSLPILHFFDKCAAKDNNLNLAVLWWKAISGNRLGSTTFDGFIAHDLLPSFTRMIVSFPLCWLYPNLHHQNVALRTAFLDSALFAAVENDNLTSTNDAAALSLKKTTQIPRIITLGAGFDTRSLRLGTNETISEKRSDNKMAGDFYEVDLPAVVAQKSSVFKRFLVRRPESIMPKLYGADLNDLDEVKKQLHRIFTEGEQINAIGIEKRPTVFIIEAVLMYLEEKNVMPLLQMCMSEAAIHSSSVQLCFADRLPHMPHNDKDLLVERKAAEVLLRSVGLDLKIWQPKPGRARHMGIAQYIMA